MRGWVARARRAAAESGLQRHPRHRAAALRRAWTWLGLAALRLLRFPAGRTQQLLLALGVLVGDRFQLQAGAALRIVLDRYLDDAALLQLAEQHLFGERLLDLFLDQPAERARAHPLVVAA